MNIRQWLKILFGYGEPGRSGRKPGSGFQAPPELSPEELLSRAGKGKREVRGGVLVYYPTISESAQYGQNLHAIIAGRNRLTTQGGNSGTVWNYQGQRFRTNDGDEAVEWAVNRHLTRQTERRGGNYDSRGVDWR
ncbi:MAG: hypothetical protein KGI50_06620 [Patescibacteria group bacterium]|nr:hypothetical protein [Patescibacteria group bacterium]MDE2439114.1 hypothetical protein [Patescibacteria group bacterium]